MEQTEELDKKSAAMKANGWIDCGATFSNDSAYRYDLWREWEKGKPMRLWVMLNPSTADEYANDPTVERCERRSRADGFGSIVVVNIFALRSTDPRVLYQHDDPIGRTINDGQIQKHARAAGQVVCAWGAHGKHLLRGAQVIEMLRSIGIKPYVLGLTAKGEPVHPLYVNYELKPFRL